MFGAGRACLAYSESLENHGDGGKAEITIDIDPG
jgi:hypothetical protein